MDKKSVGLFPKRAALSFRGLITQADIGLRNIKN